MGEKSTLQMINATSNTNVMIQHHRLSPLAYLNPS